MGEFGDKFRKARESKELSLDDVSNVTKISARMLQAIEDEHFDQLPGGVFNKGFIRAYAKHLGLNSDDAVTDYLACLRQAQIDAHEVWQPERPAPVVAPVAAPVHSIVAAPPAKPATRVAAPVEVVEELPDLQLPRAEHVHPRRKEFPDSPPFAIPWKLVGIAALILIAVFFLWARRSHASHTSAAKSATVAAAPAPSMASAQPQPSPASTQVTAPTASKPQQSAPNAAAPSKLAPSAAAATPSTNADVVAEKVIRKGDVTIRSFGDLPTTTAATESTATLSLVIRATETSWISVTSDGQLVTQETLIAPANTTIHGSREIVVRVGNAAGVTFLWNGQELPPQGAESEAKTLVFDSQGMHSQSATPASDRNQ